MAKLIEGRESGFKNNPDYKVLFEPSPRRVRVTFNGVTIADSINAQLLFETRHLPVYYFPRADVRMELLTPTAHQTFCPYKGKASYWTVRVGDRTSENAVWGYPDPYDEVAPIRDFVAFYWDRVDHWYEEDEEIFVHPRDPYKRVDVVASSRPVKVILGGETIAETRRARFLFETRLPTRYYIPPRMCGWISWCRARRPPPAPTKAGRVTGRRGSGTFSTPISCGATRSRSRNVRRSKAFFVSSTSRSTRSWSMARRCRGRSPNGRGTGRNRLRRFPTQPARSFDQGSNCYGPIPRKPHSATSDRKLLAAGKLVGKASNFL